MKHKLIREIRNNINDSINKLNVYASAHGELSKKERNSLDEAKKELREASAYLATLEFADMLP